MLFQTRCRVEIVQTIREYLKVLIWPILALIVIFFFWRRIRLVLERIRRDWITSLKILLGVIVLALLVWLVFLRRNTGLWPEWTGFGAYTGKLEADNRGKSLWDWMDLLIIPVVLALAALYINRQQRRNELTIEDNRAQDLFLQSYYDKMTELLISEKLREKEQGDEAIVVARARTLTTVRRLDGERKGMLLRFLYEANLLDAENPVMSLQTADFSKADLKNVSLVKICLKGANLQGANMEWANLKEANLQGADLRKANLHQANLHKANLQGSNLQESNLSKVYLREAILRYPDMPQASIPEQHMPDDPLPEFEPQGIDLKGVNLQGADLQGADLAMANLNKTDLQGADLQGADLTRAILENAKLQSANLQGADLSWASLESANLDEANLDGADLEEVNLRYAKGITDYQLAKAKSLKYATMPDGTIYKEED